MFRRTSLPLCLCAALLFAAGCKRMHRNSNEYVFVVSKQAFLRDRIAAISNKVAPVVNGERLQVIERSRRFLKVKNDKGQTGWLEEHAVIDQGTYSEFEKLRTEHAHDPVVATAILRDDLYAHISPGRQSDRFMLLPENDKLQLLVRASVAKPTPEQLFAAEARKQAAKVAAAQKAASPAKASSNATPAAPAPKSVPPLSSSAQSKGVKTQPAEPPQMEDWWLVRDAHGQVGWLLARRLDVDVPDEVVRYAEGQKIVGAYLLAKIYDPESPFPDKQAPEYVAVLNPYKDGLPYDFSQVRVFVWNAKKHRYEGGLRLKEVVGYLPVSVKQQSLPSPQTASQTVTVPTFTIRLAVDGATPAIDPDTGMIKPVTTFPETYRLDGETVRRVLAPGEQSPVPASSLSPEEQARHKERQKLREKLRAERQSARHRR